MHVSGDTATYTHGRIVTNAATSAFVWPSIQEVPSPGAIRILVWTRAKDNVYMAKQEMLLDKLSLLDPMYLAFMPWDFLSYLIPSHLSSFWRVFVFQPIKWLYHSGSDVKYVLQPAQD